MISVSIPGEGEDVTPDSFTWHLDWAKIRFLMRYDGMTDHSSGTLDENGVFKLTDAARNRLTGGLTLCGSRGRINAELRLNYEKYFYKKAALAKESERDKLVMEVMVHF